MASVTKNKSSFVRRMWDMPLLVFGWGWLAVFILALLDFVWTLHNWLKLPSAWFAFRYLLPLIALKLLYSWLGRINIPGLRSFFQESEKNHLADRVFLGGEFFLLARSGSNVVCLLTYLLCTLPFPVIDPQLNAIDHMMGFDWASAFRWTSHYPIYIFLKSIYYSLFFQTVFFITWFSYLSNKARLYELFWILLLSVVLTALVSGFFPAVGPAFANNDLQDMFARIQPLGKSIYTDVMAIKAGHMPDFAHHGLTGIITFPSFHTAYALAFIYGFRHTGWLGYAICVLNILVLLSIPSIGNHYLIDILTGAIIAAAAILTVRIVFEKVQPEYLASATTIKPKRRKTLS